MAYLCLNCSEEFAPDDSRITDKSHPHYGGCPGCGHKGIPADTEKERVTVSITWHELRCLVIWAERWASQAGEAERKSMQRTVYGIADRLQMQHMDRTPGLTLSSEIAELRAEFGRVDQNVIRED